MKTGKKAVAHHEAGHAVVARVLGVPVEHVTLESDGTPRALTHSAAWLVKGDNIAANVAGFETDAKIAFAGAHAQIHYRPLSHGGKLRAQREGGGWTDDWANARSCVAMILLLQGGLLKPGEQPEPGMVLPRDYQPEANALFERLLKEAGELVGQNWSAIGRVATALLNGSVLDQDELDALMAG